jgi:Protein of unknown function (DUF3617)
MQKSNVSLLAAALALGVLAMPVSALAFAGHGKPGLWQISTKMDMGHMFTPEQEAQMRAHGIPVPANNVFTVTHCVTPEEAAMTRPPESFNRQKECKLANLKTAGETISADMVCSGAEVQGGGHFQMTYDSPEHYIGKVSMSMTTHGHAIASTTTMEGKWLSADCKAK